MTINEEIYINKQIDNFITVVETQIECIDAIKAGDYQDHYKKILYLSQMEMLSKAVYGDKYLRDNRGKINDFLNEFCDWKYSNYISVPKLFGFFNRVENCPDKLKGLENHINDLMYKYLNKHKDIDLSFDVDIDELSRFLDEKTLNKMIKVKIKGIDDEGKFKLGNFIHTMFFYDLRNSYIHENRPNGHDYRLVCKEPTYVYVEKVDENGNYFRGFELNYPTNFFKQLLINALPKMKTYLKEHSINPYDNFKIISDWIPM